MRNIVLVVVGALTIAAATDCSDESVATDASTVTADRGRTEDFDTAVQDLAEDAESDPEMVTDPSDLDAELSSEDTADATGDESGEQACVVPADLPSVSIITDGRYRYIEALEYPNLLPRTIRIYLPDGYRADSTEGYPVLYMHDGQNLFRDEDSAYGEWRVDETLDGLTASGAVPPTIVVGVDNSDERMVDYSPDFDPGYGFGGKGDDYADFLVELVKPLVDTHFATRCGRTSTSIAGSSMGGLISLHTYMRHPHVFGGVGSVSPSLWWHDGVAMDNFEDFDGRNPARLWLDGGSLEGASPGSGVVPPLITNIRRVRDVAIDRGMVVGESLGFLEDPGAAHNEHSWANRLDSILWFLLSDQRPANLATDSISLFVYDDSLELLSVPNRTTVAVETQHGSVRLTWPNADVELESAEPTVAAVDSQGTVSAVGSGDTEIVAVLRGQTARAPVTVFSQETASVTFSVDVPVNTPPSDTVFVAGSIPELGEWQPNGLALNRAGDQLWEITIPLPATTTFEFKITRGIWDTVEKYADGSERPNRRWSVTPGETVEVTVERWADR